MPTKISAKKEVAKKTPLSIKRYFTKAGESPFDQVGWRTVRISVPLRDGTVAERDLEFPEFWSDSAARIAGAKYFRGREGSVEWETSARQMISRVANTLTGWGIDLKYYTTEEAEIFRDELTYILLHQRCAFNSPVWFNVGIDEKPQCSACFILSIEDSMESILDWIKTEGLIFKRGSGAGVNLSPLRGSIEKLAKGGSSSGPVSFMRGADSVAGMIASGGSTRRAAKMVVLNIDHPDVMKFIRAKAEEEKKVRALIEAGYNMADLNNEAWNSIQYQNANNSVRISDEFMQSYEDDGSYSTRFIKSGEVAATFRARDLMRQIAQAAWECGDPGVQYDTTINRWHTIPNSGRINASNPCSEYMSVDDSSCNLASINLFRYLKPDHSFDVPAFVHTVRVIFLAQEMMIDKAAYPTEAIEKHTRAQRQIGLGYANLGALLMRLGIAYDSEEARHTAGAITALMTGEAYKMSGEIARLKGPFADFEKNKDATVRVLEMHTAALANVRADKVFDGKILVTAGRAWGTAVMHARRQGVRNSQATVIAPTGTIAFMMDCNTTGAEPEFALVKTKMLVGGGTMRIVNSIVPAALKHVGYSDEEASAIVSYIETEGTIEGAPGLKDEHLPIFDCAVAPGKGVRSISWKGHVKMVAAIQPFISGAISKTFNMPANTTVEEIEEAYVMGWKMGIKAFAVYRDGSKAAQPLSTSGTKYGMKQKVSRRFLPKTRPAETHKFSIAGHEGYLTYGMFPDTGEVGEIFVRMSKQGSTLAGLLDAFAISTSVALQYGVPLKAFVKKYSYSRFEPSGFTENPDIQTATSITDYIFRYLAMRFLSPSELDLLGIKSASDLGANGKELAYLPTKKEEVVVSHRSVDTVTAAKEPRVFADGVCKACGGMLVQTGSCRTCIQCGTSNGGC